MERADVDGRLTGSAARPKRPARTIRFRFWLLNLYAAAIGGPALCSIGLILSLFAAAGVLNNSEGLGIVVTALIVTGLASLLWAAHAMDRVTTLRAAIDGSEDKRLPL